MALCVSVHAQHPLPLPRWCRGGDRPEAGCASGVPLWSAAPAPRSTMIPTEEMSARRREVEDKLKQVWLGRGGRRGSCRCVDVGPGLQPQRVASETGLVL